MKKHNLSDAALQHEIDLILAEDEHRRILQTSCFDPVSGVGSVGQRFEFHFNDTTFRLPVAMRSEPFVKQIAESGGSLEWLKKHPEHTPEALERIFNLIRCRHDFPFWAAKYAYIKRKGGGEDMLFRLNRPQRRLVELFEQMRCEGKPIRVILLKARQWGGITCVQLYIAWLQLIHNTGLNSLIIAHQSAATEEIRDMFDRMIAQYPLSMLYAPNEEFDPKAKKP